MQITRAPPQTPQATQSTPRISRFKLGTDRQRLTLVPQACSPGYTRLHRTSHLNKYNAQVPPRLFGTLPFLASSNVGRQKANPQAYST